MIGPFQSTDIIYGKLVDGARLRWFSHILRFLGACFLR